MLSHLRYARSAITSCLLPLLKIDVAQRSHPIHYECILLTPVNFEPHLTVRLRNCCCLLNSIIDRHSKVTEEDVCRVAAMATMPSILRAVGNPFPHAKPTTY